MMPVEQLVLVTIVRDLARSDPYAADAGPNELICVHCNAVHVHEHEPQCVVRRAVEWVERNTAGTPPAPTLAERLLEIVRAEVKASGSVSAAARRLGVHRRTVQRWLKAER